MRQIPLKKRLAKKQRGQNTLWTTPKFIFSPDFGHVEAAPPKKQKQAEKKDCFFSTCFIF